MFQQDKNVKFVPEMVDKLRSFPKSTFEVMSLINTSAFIQQDGYADQIALLASRATRTYAIGNIDSDHEHCEEHSLDLITCIINSNLIRKGMGAEQHDKVIADTCMDIVKIACGDENYTRRPKSADINWEYHKNQRAKAVIAGWHRHPLLSEKNKQDFAEQFDAYETEISSKVPFLTPAQLGNYWGEQSHTRYFREIYEKLACVKKDIQEASAQAEPALTVQKATQAHMELLELFEREKNDVLIRNYAITLQSVSLDWFKTKDMAKEDLLCVYKIGHKDPTDPKWMDPRTVGHLWMTAVKGENAALMSFVGNKSRLDFGDDLPEPDGQAKYYDTKEHFLHHRDPVSLQIRHALRNQVNPAILELFPAL